MRVCKTPCPQLYACDVVPKLALCMVHLFHMNEAKFDFLKKLFGPETECKLFADNLEME